MQRYYRFLQWTLTVVMSITLLSAAVQPASAADSAPAAQGPGERRGYHPQTGMLTFLGASPDQPIAVAGAAGPDLTLDVRGEAILQAYAGEFGVRNPSEELTLARQSVSANGQQTVRYQQVYQGVPVMGGELIVNMNENGELLSMNGEVSPGLAISTAPRVSADAARAAALALVAKYYNLKESDLSVSEPALWIYDPRLLVRSNSPAELVWRMDVTAAGAPVRQLVLIGAEKGKVSLTFNQIDTAWIGAGAYGAPAASSAPASEAPSAALVLGTPNLETYNLGGATPDPISGGTLLCSNSSRTCGSGDSDGNDAHAFAYDTYMAYSSLHSRDSIDGAGMTIKSYVHFGVGYQNAFWDGAEMVYGDGFSAADDVVGHELTHGVTQNESNLFYFWESGAINESFSDVWGEYVDQINGDGTDTPAVKWLMGEDIPGFGAIRNMKNPPAFGDPDSMLSPNYCESGNCYDYDNGGVHYNSGVNNKAVFLMVDGGSFGGKVVTALGWTKTLTVYYEAQTNLLTSASGYYDLYNALYQACLNSIGVNGIVLADCQEVRDATDAVRMNKEPAPNYNPNVEACLSGYSPYPMLTQDFESGMAGWTFGAGAGSSSANWTLWSASPWFWGDPYATSGVESMYADDDDGIFADYAPNDSWIVSPPIPLTAGTNPYLIFSHQFLLDYYGSSYYDGGVLEYSTDSGSTWKDAAPLFSGGQNYKGTLSTWDSNALGGRKAFTGDSHGWVDSRYKLTSLVGQTVQFRWRMGTDSSVATWGWFIDDVVVNDCLKIPSVPVLLSPGNNALVTDYTPLLDWRDSTGDLDHYWLQVDDNSDFSSPHFDANVGGTSSWEITPGNILNSNTKYYWRVKAFDAAGGASNWSAVRYFRTSILPPAFLSQPSNGVILLNKRPLFDWDAVSGATRYTLQVSRESDFTPLLWNRTVTTDSYMPTTDLPADTLLYWRVRTAAPNGPSVWTATWSFTTGNPPTVPVLTAPANNALLTDYSPLLDWNASTAPAGTTLSYYNVQVDDDPAFGSPEFNTSISASATAIEVTPDLAPGTKYYWRVSAYNTDSEYSAWSAVRYFRTAFIWPVQSTPANGSTTASLKPTFTWEALTGATSYTIQVSTSPTFSPLAINKTVTTAIYTPTANLLSGTTYYWRVRANGPFGPGLWQTSPFSFTTP